MIRRTFVLAALVAVVPLSVLAMPAGAARSQPMRGTFKVTAGSCTASAVTGSYFRMIYPGGTVAVGKFFTNPDSTCSDKTYTVVRPGTQGGLVTGSYQPDPTPAFNAQGGALASDIIEPQSFTGIDFSIATNEVDPQSQQNVAPPAVERSGGKLTGEITAWSAAWNKLYFNQGSPKPGGSLPGLTAKLTGIYNPKTRAYVLTWTSQVVGGPFNGFTGEWHLSGTFVPKR